MHVVEADAGDDRQHRFRNVGRIKAAAESGFEHGQIDAGPRKVHERHGRQHLEPGRTVAAATSGCAVHLFHGRNDGLEGPHKVGGGDRPTAHTDPLLDRVDVRRHVAAHPMTGRLQRGGQHGHRRSLALGARHVDDRERLVRILDGRQQSPDPAQPKRARARGGRHDSFKIDPAVEPRQRRLASVSLFA